MTNVHRNTISSWFQTNIIRFALPLLSWCISLVQMICWIQYMHCWEAFPSFLLRTKTGQQNWTRAKAKGYMGALYHNRQLTCCFCSCNLFLAILSVAWLGMMRPFASHLHHLIHLSRLSLLSNFLMDQLDSEKSSTPNLQHFEWKISSPRAHLRYIELRSFTRGVLRWRAWRSLDPGCEAVGRNIFKHISS